MRLGSRVIIWQVQKFIFVNSFHCACGLIQKQNLQGSPIILTQS